MGAILVLRAAAGGEGREGVAPPLGGLSLSGLQELPWVPEMCEGLLEERLRLTEGGSHRLLSLHPAGRKRKCILAYRKAADAIGCWTWWHCVSQCARIAPEEERLSPELFSREDSLPPCFRLLSTERRSEWKPSPNMTSKLLLTMS